MLEVNDIVFSRNGEGALIPQEVALEGLPKKPTVKVRPLTRGELQEIYQQTQGSNEDKLQADTNVLKKGLVQPKLTDEQLSDLKPQFAGAITTAILSVSLGLSQEDVNKQTQEVLSGQELALKKN